MWRRGCAITYAASFTVPRGMLSRPGDFDHLRDDITFTTSPFVTGPKTNFLPIGFMQFLLQDILAKVASYIFGLVV